MALHLIKNPVGTFHFVGRVPDCLAYETDRPQAIKDARQFGPGLIIRQAEREGFTFRTKTWATKEAALEEAEAQGFVVSL